MDRLPGEFFKGFSVFIELMPFANLDRENLISQKLLQLNGVWRFVGEPMMARQ